MADIIPPAIRFNSEGLIPAVIQDHAGGRVLMLAYMNREALEKTLTTGQTWFYSRSRKELWHKGATSGHYQQVVSACYDCDADTLLFKVRQIGAACHTGEFTCFHNDLPVQAEKETGTEQQRAVIEHMRKEDSLAEIITRVFQVIEERKMTRPEGSYTSYLFNEGRDKILKKVGEEAAETIIASKNDSGSELLYEMADLYYHTLVLLAQHNLNPAMLAAELARRLPKK